MDVVGSKGSFRGLRLTRPNVTNNYVFRACLCVEVNALSISFLMGRCNRLTWESVFASDNFRVHRDEGGRMFLFLLFIPFRPMEL